MISTIPTVIATNPTNEELANMLMTALGGLVLLGIVSTALLVGAIHLLHRWLTPSDEEPG